MVPLPTATPIPAFHCPNGVVSVPIPYPNPARDRIHIRLRFTLCKPSPNVRIKVFTSAHRLILDKPLGAMSAGTKDVGMELKDKRDKKWANGTYYVVVQSGSEWSLGKILVMH